MTDEQQLKLERFARENELSDGATDDLIEMVGKFIDEAEGEASQSAQLNQFAVDLALRPLG